jgi:hypothetical protein
MTQIIGAVVVFTLVFCFMLWKTRDKGGYPPVPPDPPGGLHVQLGGEEIVAQATTQSLPFTPVPYWRKKHSVHCSLKKTRRKTRKLRRQLVKKNRPRSYKPHPLRVKESYRYQMAAAA